MYMFKNAERMHTLRNGDEPKYLDKETSLFSVNVLSSAFNGTLLDTWSTE